MYRINKSLTEYLTAIKLALTNLGYNKLRTFLSVMGIVVGVVSVILVMSTGLGVKKYIIMQMEAFGSGIVDVQIKIPQTSKTSAENAGGITMGTPITTLKIKDMEELAKNKNVVDWYAISMEQQVLSYKSENQTSFIMGTSAGFYNIDEQAKIAQGEFFTEEDDKALAQVIVLGSKAKKELFGTQNAVGQMVKMKGKSYKVIGVLQERGSTGFFDFDTLAYIPIRTMMKKIQGVDYITEAVFKVNDESKMTEIAADMTLEMRRIHNISNPDKDDFAVTSMDEMKDIINKVFKTINILLVALTSISLIVGGVGITNVMYVAVAERTFEIGLRKAVGASSANIRHQFLFESVVITLIGAFLGILISIGLMAIISRLAANFGFDIGFILSGQAIAISAIFSCLTGIIFGYYPAKKASELTPLEAIRK